MDLFVKVHLFNKRNLPFAIGLDFGLGLVMSWVLGWDFGLGLVISWVLGFGSDK
jgi:hypothetical protein